MKMCNLALTCAIGAVLAAFQYAASGATVVIKTETFNSALSAQTNNWWEWASRLNDQDFGFSPTGNASGSAGEGGGHTTRDDSPTRPFYADVFGAATAPNNGPLVFTNSITNAGKFIFTAPISTVGSGEGVMIGHFYADTSANDTPVGESQRSGFGVGESDTPEVPDQMRLSVALPTGGSVLQSGYRVVTGQQYAWSWVWQPPPAGSLGGGRVVMKLTGTVWDIYSGLVTGTFSYTNDLPTSFNPANVAVNGFGMWHTKLGTRVIPGEALFFDNVTYTAVTGGTVPCMKAGPPALTVPTGVTNKFIVVSVPPVLNRSNDFYATVTSLNPAFAVPKGAVGGVLTVKFAAGQACSTNIYVQTVTNNAAVTTFAVGNTNSICVAVSPITINIPYAPPPGVTTQALEAFTTAASARNNGWWEWLCRLNGNDYGWTNNGAPPGGAGGLQVRSTLRTGYADVLAGTNWLTLNDSLTVTGRVFIASGGSGAPRILCGHFNWAGMGTIENSDAPPDCIGIQFYNNENGRVRSFVTLSDGTLLSDTTILNNPKLDTWFDFGYTYDPSGGPSGNGRLNVWLRGLTTSDFYGTYACTTDLEAWQRTIGARFNAFGVQNRTDFTSSATQSRVCFFDNCWYTVPGLPDSLPDIKTYPASTAAAPGSTNQVIWVGIPPALNKTSARNVTVTSLNPSVAVPVGGNPLVVTFAGGGDNVQPVYVRGVSGGDALFAFSNSYGLNIATNQVAVTVFPAPGATATTSETFDDADSAAAHGWLENLCRENGQNYGWSDSGAAAGYSGEIGGVIVKNNARSYYGALSCGRLSLNDPITAHGKIFIGHANSSYEVNLGHFNSADGAGAQNILGFGISQGPSFSAMIGLADGTKVEGPLQTGGAWAYWPIDWDYSYDPNGGPDGLGRLTIAWMHGWDSTWRTNTLDLTLAQRTAGATFNGFGLVNRGGLGNNPADTAELYVDEVTYTVGGTVQVQNVETVPVNQWRLTFCSAGTNHLVQQCSSVSPGSSWSTVPSVTFSGPNKLVWTATFAKPGTTGKYYRIVANP